MCNRIKIRNLYPYQKEHYQLDYSAFIFVSVLQTTFISKVTLVRGSEWGSFKYLQYN